MTKKLKRFPLFLLVFFAHLAVIDTVWAQHCTLTEGIYKCPDGSEYKVEADGEGFKHTVVKPMHLMYNGSATKFNAKDNDIDIPLNKNEDGQYYTIIYNSDLSQRIEAPARNLHGRWFFELERQTGVYEYFTIHRAREHFEDVLATNEANNASDQSQGSGANNDSSGNDSSGDDNNENANNDSEGGEDDDREPSGSDDDNNNEEVSEAPSCLGVPGIFNRVTKYDVQDRNSSPYINIPGIGGRYKAELKKVNGVWKAELKNLFGQPYWATLRDADCGEETAGSDEGDEDHTHNDTCEHS